MTKPIRSVIDVDQQIAEEILEIAASGRSLPSAERASVTPEHIARYVDARLRSRLGGEESVASPPVAGELEAIVRRFGRPALFVQRGNVQVPTSDAWRQRLAPYLPYVEPMLAGVGRVEVIGHPDHDWIGTAWVVDERTVVTNRHVARLFAQGEPGAFRFRAFAGETMKAHVDFVREHDNIATNVLGVERVLYLAPDRDEHADIAVLRLASHDGLPDPIELSDAEPEGWIVAVGYPGWDGQRNDADVMARLFGDTYGVKRFAPGRVLAWRDDFTFTHDCSTLGGNSGSVLIDLAEGRAVGLHFAGTYGRENHAVKASELKRVLGEQRVSELFGAGAEEASRPRKSKAKDDPTRDAEWFADGRDGYLPGFLGGGREAPMPGLGTWESDVAEVDGGGHELKYRHFSVVMSKSRMMALFTAVNIDGNKLLRPKREGDRWYLDPRIPREHQIGNADAYTKNPLDRGHLVRRLDPVWGPSDVASQAEEDTFHYTNSSPQHSALNQRTWLALEDYVLNRTDDEEMRACVFSGPVLRNDDPRYREIRLPREYWKIAVAIDKDTKKLSAAGYLLSQARNIRDLGEEAAFGAFRTYQVPIADIATMTGLGLAKLVAVDAWGETGDEEAPGLRRKLIQGPEDVRLS